MLFTITSKIYWSLGAIQCSREYKKFLKSISIHFNCSFMQQKQQTSGHNNISLLKCIHVSLNIFSHGGGSVLILLVITLCLHLHAGVVALPVSQ